MAADGSVVIQIEGDDSDLKSKLNSIGDIAAGAAKTAVAAIAGIGVAVTALAAEMAQGIADTAAYGDNIDKMSQKMGMSAEAYQEWDAIMQHSGTSIASLQSGMKTLANAVESGNDAFERLGITQEQIATMNNEELFSAVISSLQNVENETERTYLAGQLLGRGATELGALLNTSAEDTEAMRQRVHELGGVMSDEAVKAAAAYQDSLQDMQTAFSGLSRGLTSEFLPSVTTIMDGITEIFAGDSDTGIGMVSNGINDIIDTIGGAVPQLLEKGTDIVNALVGGIVENLPGFTDAALDLLVALGQGLIDNIPTITSSAAEIVGSLAESVVEAIPELADTGTQIILQLAQSVIDGLPGMVPAAVQTISSLVEQITNNLDQIIEAGIQVIVALGEGIIEALPDLIEKVPEIVSNIANVINDNAPKLLAAAAKLIVELGKGLIENIPTLVKNIPKIIQAVVDVWSAFNWLNLGKNAITAIKDGIKNMIPQVKTAGKNVLDAVVNAIKSLPQTLENLGRTGVAGLANVIRNLANSAWGAMKELASGLINSITDLPSKMLDIGKNIVDGIANGIKNGAASAINAVTDLAGSLVDKAKRALGIQSPSRVMAKEVGPYIPQGVAVGVEKEIPKVERSMEKQLAGLTDRVRAAVEAETSNISVGMTAKSGGSNGPEPIPGGGMVINVYVDGGSVENTEKARNTGRELGTEAAREMRRRGVVPV